SSSCTRSAPGGARPRQGCGRGSSALAACGRWSLRECTNLVFSYTLTARPGRVKGLPGIRSHRLCICTPVSSCAWGLCLLRNLLDRPKEEVGARLFDPEPFQLGSDLTAVIGRVIDNVAQHRPSRQAEGAADRAQRQHGVEPLRGERGTQ